MKIYLDNCCYNRPYDDQSQIQVSLESQAKLHIQELIRLKRLDMVSSYILDYENSQNPYQTRSITIRKFLDKNAIEYVGAAKDPEIISIAKGIHTADAYHIACAEYTKCNYFITTDKRLLKYKSLILQIVDPVDFVQISGGGK
jgi:predicted nucleic acid-binding protein